MKKTIGMLSFLLAMGAASPLLAFDFDKFAVDKTMKCAHPTVKDIVKTEYVNPAKMEGAMETARVRVFYKGMLKNNSILVNYSRLELKEPPLVLIKAEVLEDSAGTGTGSCKHFGAWEEIK